MAEGGDRAVDDLGGQGPDRFEPQAQPFGDPRLEILDEDVGGRDQAPGDVQPFVGFQIQRDRFLVAPLNQVGEAQFPRRKLWNPAAIAGPVAFAGFFDLDHLGAHEAQKVGGVGSGEHLRQVDDPQALERLKHLCGPRGNWGRGPGPDRAVGYCGSTPALRKISPWSL